MDDLRIENMKHERLSGALHRDENLSFCKVSALILCTALYAKTACVTAAVPRFSVHNNSTKTQDTKALPSAARRSGG